MGCSSQLPDAKLKYHGVEIGTNGMAYFVLSITNQAPSALTFMSVSPVERQWEIEILNSNHWQKISLWAEDSFGCDDVIVAPFENKKIFACAYPITNAWRLGLMYSFVRSTVTLEKLGIPRMVWVYENPISSNQIQSIDSRAWGKLYPEREGNVPKVKSGRR